MFEDVGAMDGGGWPERLAGGLDGEMVECNGFDDRCGEAPDSEQAGADFGVAGADETAFGGPEAQLLFAGALEGCAKLFGHVRGEKEFADVVQLPCGKGLLAYLGSHIFQIGDRSRELARGH